MSEHTRNRTGKPNLLINEKSPYLLQHAYNPVEWRPWSEEAFQKAKQENKPVFLSIGYATCHWCHVMERESFEDEEVAALLNESFVSIKVDREERPDIDHIYMAVCQALTGSGGWPLTVLLTPDQKPFFAGTYFPKRRQMGRVGLMELLGQIIEVWQNDPDEVTRASTELHEALNRQDLPPSETGWRDELAHRACRSFMTLYDKDYGGFGSAPKFPSPHNLLFLMNYGERFGDKNAGEMAFGTLDGMARGGIRDHVGGGFARYSVDAQWLVPHFEKMLYDNALLALAYTEAWLLTKRDLYAQIVEEIITYILRDMTGPDGEFYSAEDADSDGEEGLYYIWTPDDIDNVLGAEDSDRFCALYGITPEGNFEGASIPNLLAGDLEERAKQWGIAAAELRQNVRKWHAKLLAERVTREHPLRDDKVLTAWNGLAIAAMARASAVFGRKDWAEAAERATAFIDRHLIREDGRLLARYRDGEAAFLAYLDDYCFLAWGLIELYQATFRTEYLIAAKRLIDQAIPLFSDEEGRAYYFTGRDAEPLIRRMKETYDGAIPAGNSVMAYILLRLASLLGDEGYRIKGVENLDALAGSVERSYSGHSMLLLAGLLGSGGGTEVVIAAGAQDPVAEQMLKAARSVCKADTAILWLSGEQGEQIRQINESLSDKIAQNGKATAYVCRNFACRAPVHTAEDLVKMVAEL